MSQYGIVEEVFPVPFLNLLCQSLQCMVVNENKVDPS